MDKKTLPNSKIQIQFQVNNTMENQKKTKKTLQENKVNKI